jgi:hypothetical protein
MSEETRLQAEVENPPIQSANSTALVNDQWNRNVRFLIGLCCVLIIGSFFIPWIQLIFGPLSGFQIQQLPSDEAKLVWAIPVAALGALFAIATKTGISCTSMIVGAMPFIALAYYFQKLGQGFFQALQMGAWVTLCLGAALFVLPFFRQK